jgi:transcriptional regulator with XRE-family HTH domain
MTQEALAEAAELSTVGVALVEGARTNVTTATLCQLAHALGVDVARLLRMGAARRQTAERSPRPERALAANPGKRSTHKRGE